MRTNHPRFITSIGALAASGILLIATPTGSSEALHRPPMPCVAIRAGIYPVGAGFCPRTTGTIEWHKFASAVRAAGTGAAVIASAHLTPIPT